MNPFIIILVLAFVAGAVALVNYLKDKAFIDVFTGFFVLLSIFGLVALTVKFRRMTANG